MLYFIGGASRSGKTLLARKMLKEKGVPYFSLDFLMMGFFGASLEDVDPANDDFDNADRLWPTVKALSQNVLSNKVPYSIEGAFIKPKNIAVFSDQNPGSVRACFLGYPDLDPHQKLIDVRQYKGLANDWMSGLPDNEALAHLKRHVELSAEIQADCANSGIKFFDSGQEFCTVIDDAFQLLTTE